MKIIIAIDGPAGSGKGTIGRALAEEFNLAYMDTGKLYRAVAYLMMINLVPSGDKGSAIKYAKELGHKESWDILNLDILSTEKVGVEASKIAGILEVRKALEKCQRDFAREYPKDKYGSILDGRDIGTVICPNADVKLFITASPEIRVMRRHKELIKKGQDSISAKEVLEQIKYRDKKDTERSNSPLIPEEDAVIIDTSDLSIEKAIDQATEIIINRKNN